MYDINYEYLCELKIKWYFICGSRNMNALQKIIESKRTVFTMQNVAMLLGVERDEKLSSLMHYYAKRGELQNLRRGIYAKQGYNVEEMACSIFKPSYISLEYVLARSGVVFQWDETITSVSYLSRTIEIDKTFYSYRKISHEIWGGYDGIEICDNVYKATPERAFLDMVYLSDGQCYFDNLHPLNKKEIKRLLPFYKSERLCKMVAQLLN